LNLSVGAPAPGFFRNRGGPGTGAARARDRSRRTTTMPATEGTDRSQPTLHVVFAISSVAMTLVIVWMVMADHLRPWKQVQREFHRIEEAKLKATEREKLQEQKTKYQAQIDQIDSQIRQAEDQAHSNAPEIRKVEAE